MRFLEALRGDARYLGDAQEGEKALNRRLGVGDQIFITDLVAAARVLLRERDHAPHGGQPVGAHRGDAVARVLGHVRVEAEAGQAPRAGLDAGCDDVHAVAAEADELRVRPHLGKQVAEQDVIQRLVTPPPLPAHRDVPPEVRGKNPADGSRRRQRDRALAGRPGPEEAIEHAHHAA